MQPVTVYANNPPNTIKHTSISQQTWEIRDLKKSKASIPLNDNNNFVINMISIDALVGSVMIVPFFSLHQNNKNQSTNKIDSPVFGQPKTSDKFWCVDRNFFDRSGWEELKENSSNSSTSSSNIRDGINIDNIQSFINQYSIPGILDFEELHDQFQTDYFGEDNDDDVNDNLLIDEIEGEDDD